MLHGRSSKEAIEEELHKFAFETKMYAEEEVTSPESIQT
jgi:hypothetical protein